jgi:hypothetical protein
VRYVLLFVETEEFAAQLAALPDDERERAYALAGKWFADHADKLRAGSKLLPPETATTVRLDGEGPVVTDGPFVEGKEVVSGYAEVEADDLDEVLRMVRTWPGCPVVEVRPVETAPPGL